ncbi:MAG: arylamine N-acetyltransferase [Lachnospiraceae bacterium]|nr:arylamine N-acetyltransferase [Lachnospiraceae bacterium]
MKEQLTQYFERIGMKPEDANELNLDLLNKIIFAHMTHIPFENLDIYPVCKGISLEDDALFNKMVINKHGGFCFEQNGLHVNMLKALGFESHSVMAKILWSDGTPGGLFHRGVITKIKGKRYYSDVGFGGPMSRYAISLDGEKTPDNFWMEPIDDCWYQIKRITSENESVGVMNIGIQAFLGSDFQMNCDALLAMEKSPFRTGYMLNLRTNDGNIHINGLTYGEEHDGVKTEREITQDEFFKIVNTKFNIQKAGL